MGINYVEGDATLPIGNGRKVIAHVCNDGGAWGAGFVMALSARDGGPEKAYREWEMHGDLPFNAGPRFALCEIQIVSYLPKMQNFPPYSYVCNMIAQVL